MVESPPAGRSVRVQLAHVARDVALATPGVLTLDAGPVGVHTTLDGVERLTGVTVAAQEGPGERYAVDLFLTAALVPLPALVADVRERVLRAAAAAGLGQALGSVNVTVLDVEAPELSETS